MSTGSFLQTKYEVDTGEVASVTLQPETLELTIGGQANAAPSAAINTAQTVNVSGGRKQKGVNARRVRFRILTAGTSGLAVGSVISLPWLVADTFLQVTRPGRQTGTYYGGATVRVVGGTAEDFVVR